MENLQHHSLLRGSAARAFALAVIGGGAALVGSPLAAATAAGQEIRNVATVTYLDAAGNSYTAESNEALVTVAPVYSATIGVDTDKLAAAGESVYLPYELSNTGNASDLFDIALTDGSSGAALATAGRTVYLDTDGNGLPDDGEPALSTLGLDAGESADLVVVVQMPAIALAGQIAGVTLTARAQNGTGGYLAASVEDLSPGGGRDALAGTVESRITVTEGAVLNLTKTSLHDSANSRIAYTVSVTNTGATVARDVVLFDAIPTGTSIARVGGLTSGAPLVSDAGLLSLNGDTDATYTGTLSESGSIRFNLDADDGDASEADIGLDLDGDGTISSATLAGVYARDDALAPGATVSMSFTVEYDPLVLSGGAEIANTAYLTADVDGSGTLTLDDLIDGSTRTSDTVARSHAVDITDSDGLLPTDSQRVASAASGGVAEFDIVVTNEGNADDSFELSMDQSVPDTFPSGTLFTFHDATGAVELTDANGLGGVDTGTLPRGASLAVRVRASLPQGVSGDNGGAGFAASVRALSAGDSALLPSADPASTASIDVVAIRLDRIDAASADIHAQVGGIAGSDEDPLVTTPLYGVSRTIEVDAGTSTDIPLFIDNESALSDTYRLAAGSDLDGTVLGDLPPGWSVQFFLTDDPNGDGTGALAPTGGAVSSVTVPAGRLDFPLVARVTVPAGVLQALADVDYDIDANALTTHTIDQNGDGDGDYPLFFGILSASSGATDILLESIDVTGGRALSITPGASAQVEIGGSVDYPLTLGNAGNVVEVLELVTSNSQSGFEHSVSIDANGDGAPDTPLSDLVGIAPIFVPVPPITVTLGDGSTIVLTVSNVDADAHPELILPPGVELPLLATVRASVSASIGSVDTMSFEATNIDPAADAPDASVAFQTAIVNGNVSLTKTVAVDANCDGDNLDAALGGFDADSAFETVQSVRIEPGECALWRIVAENRGDADALEVFVTDAVTPFSDFLPGSLLGCIGNGCVPVAPLPGGDVFASENGGVIRYNIGTGASATTGGTLIPGQKATLQFGVKVR